MAVLTYKCPSCSGSLVFDEKTQRMVCPSCGNSYSPQDAQAFTEAQQASSKESQYGWQSYDEQSGSGDWQQEEKENLRVYACPSCGGEIVTDATTAATSCPYCGNQTILPGQLSGMYRPDFVLPFRVGKQEAVEKLKKFYKGKPFLPKLFKSQNRVESVQGVYVPFWLFDCDVQADISYRATRVRSWRDGEYDCTETSYYSLFRAGGLAFDGVPVDGSTKMEDAYMEAIEPFDLTRLQQFNTAYLSGFLADKYDVDANASVTRANTRVKNSTEQAFASTTTGYGSVMPEHTNIRFENGRVHYALLPVWMLNTRYKNKLYTFAMNGQSGKFVGELPVSLGKFFAWFGGIFAVLEFLLLLLLK